MYAEEVFGPVAGLFRVADIEPQLKTAAAEQARAYLRRVTLELLASMDR